MAVEQGLIDDAMSALGVTPVDDLRTGGQKTVRLVDREGERVVMKVVALESAPADALRRAQREVELLQGVDSPYVVKVASDLVELGDSPPRGAAWLEHYLEGEDLGDLFSRPWDVADALEMATHVSRGLAALHEAAVVHRDLSENNIRSLDSGGYVVMDPGFARHTLKSGLTVGGQPGTPGFLSPEHVRPYSGGPTPASDVFCVGILLFRALTERLPIPFADMAEYYRRLAKVDVDDVRDHRGDIPDPVAAVIRHCLHPQPARRPRNGARLAAELEKLA